jgi:O-antigen ligase
MLGSLIVVVALAPGRTRRVYGMLVVAAGLAAAAPDLLQIYDHGAAAAIPVAVAHAAGRAALLSAVAAGAVWGLLTAGWQRARAGTVLAVRARTAGSWLLVVPVVLALAVAAVSAHRIERDISNQWHAFIHLNEAGDTGAPASTAGQTRLLSGAGNRYDYWRIAWADWRANPVLGVGAGNYPVSYYQLRATTEDIEQPHSIELQALSELGLVGGLLLVVFIAGVGWGAVRMRRQAARSPLSQALMVGGLGVFAAWLVQTSVDWLQLLPGLTAIALAGVAVLVAPRRRPDPGERTVAPSRLRRTLAGRPALALGASAVIVTLIVAGASLSRQGLAEIYLVRAQNELDAHPAAALTDANRSLDFDSDNVQTFYVKSAAFAHFDQAAAAEAALNEALAREPDNFVTWALLGDIAVRQGKLTDARRDYVRAHLLDPRDPTLQQLASDPRSALR